MGAFSDSTGAAATNIDNWTPSGGTAAPALSKYDGALQSYWPCDDAAGPVSGGRLGLGVMEPSATGVSYGSTAIIGTGTAITLTKAGMLASAKPGPTIGGARLARYTLGFWLKTSMVAPAAFWTIFGWHDSSVSTGRNIFSWTPSTGFRVIDGNTSLNLWNPTFSTIADGAAHHWAVTYGGVNDANYRLYFDGAAVGSVVSSTITEPLDTRSLLFGDGTFGVDGDISHLAYWEDSLSAAAVAEIYNSGSGRFLQS